MAFEEKKMEFACKFTTVCVKCGANVPGYLTPGSGVTKETAERLTWARTPRADGLKGCYFHKACENLPDNPEIIAAKLAKSGETTPSQVPAESKPANETRTIPKESAPVTTAPVAAPAIPAGGGDFFAGMAALLMPHLEGKIKVSASELSADLEAKIKAAVSNASKVIVIEDKRTGERRDVGRQHLQFEELMEYVKAGEHVYSYGAPGGGKSTAAKAVAKAMGLEYGYISLSAQTAESRMLGFVDANGRFVETEFYKRYKNGGVFCIEEMDNASANLLTALNTALENGHASFPCGVDADGNPAGGVVEEHEDFIMLANGNTAGYGANPMFPERRPMDGAFRERFLFQEWLYDEGFERELAMSHNEKAGKWIDWVLTVRKYANTHYPKLQVTPRASIKGAKLLKSKLTTEKVADAVIFKGFDKDSRARILAANPLPRM